VGTGNQCAAVIMSQLTVSLSNMVDLALGTPELGAVNFSVLHSLLHAMLQRLNIADVLADLPAEREDVELGHAVPRTTRQDGVKVDDRRETSDMESDSGVAGLTSAIDGGTELYADHLASKRESDKPIPVMRSPYHQLEERVGRMEHQLMDLNSLPSTKELMKSGGQESNSSSRPVADMWQGMQLSRKVDANTQGVSKVRTYCSLTQITLTKRLYTRASIGLRLGLGLGRRRRRRFRIDRGLFAWELIPFEAF